MWYLYVLKSLKDHKRYIGSTNNVSIRLSQHNSGQVRSTKYRRPLEIIYTEAWILEKEARSREKYLKTHKGYNELEKILAGRV